MVAEICNGQLYARPPLISNVQENTEEIASSLKANHLNRYISVTDVAMVVVAPVLAPFPAVEIGYAVSE